LATTRHTTTRDRHRATIRQGEPPCAICGQPIDYTLRYPDPMCYVADHIIPLVHGGPDTIANKQPAHRRCNSIKSDRKNAPIIRRSGALNRPGGGPP